MRIVAHHICLCRRWTCTRQTSGPSSNRKRMRASLAVSPIFGRKVRILLLEHVGTCCWPRRIVCVRELGLRLVKGLSKFVKASGGGRRRSRLCQQCWVVGSAGEMAEHPKFHRSVMIAEVHACQIKAEHARIVVIEEGGLAQRVTALRRWRMLRKNGVGNARNRRRLLRSTVLRRDGRLIAASVLPKGRRLRDGRRSCWVLEGVIKRRRLWNVVATRQRIDPRVGRGVIRRRGWILLHRMRVRELGDIARDQSFGGRVV